ncbi:MAG: pitrilysin family protein [Pseudomonadota bacterium]
MSETLAGAALRSLLRGWLVAALAWCVLALAPAWAAPTIEHWVQPSGARVFLVSNASLPMLDVQIDLDAGNRRDPAHQAGLAAATAALLRSGALAYGSRPELDENALAEAWADLGAQFSASATRDRLSLRLRSLSQPDLLQAAQDLLAQQLAVPAFAPPVWQRERQRWVARWRHSQTEPDVLAEQLFTQAVYGSHPYGQLARPETWAAIEATDVRAFWQRHAQACLARVTLVGDISRARADALVQALLAGWQAHGCSALPAVPEVPALTQARGIEQAFAVAQTQILLGQPGLSRRNPDFMAFMVANHILGGSGFSSRLMQEVRERRGLTYDIHSRFVPGRHAGAFQVATTTEPQRARAALELVQEQVQRFVAEGPTAQELAHAQATLINGFALRLDSNREQLEQVAAIAWHELPLDHLQTWSAQVAALDAAQVRRAAQRVLQPERMVTVLFGSPAP